MRTAALVLTILGGLLPVAGVWWGAMIARSRLELLDSWLRRDKEIKAQRAAMAKYSGGAALDVSATLAAEGIPITTYDDLGVMRILIERGIVAESLKPLRGPAMLGAVGIIAGTVGAAFAIYAP